MQNFLNNGVKRENILTIDPNNNNSDIKSINEIQDNYKADIVIFAIKPQGSEEILKEFAVKNSFNQNTIFISILAGKTIGFFENILGKDKKIIRLMPNLPILIDEGISAYFCNKNIQNGQEKELVNLFGQNLKLEKEDLINQATAISGSGPAYLFLFAKNIIESAQKIGLSKKEAQTLTKQTLFGASKMLLNEDNIDELINSVTSKGGTTQAALEEFNNSNNSLEDLVFKSINAAFNISNKLS